MSLTLPASNADFGMNGESNKIWIKMIAYVRDVQLAARGPHPARDPF